MIGSESGCVRVK